MSIVLLVFGCLLIGYAVLLAVLMRRHQPRKAESTPWVVAHIVLIGCAGVVALTSALFAGSNRSLWLLLAAVILVDALLLFIAKRTHT